jgi:hypothetical protein
MIMGKVTIGPPSMLKLISLRTPRWQSIWQDGDVVKPSSPVEETMISIGHTIIPFFIPC